MISYPKPQNFIPSNISESIEYNLLIPYKLQFTDTPTNLQQRTALKFKTTGTSLQSTERYATPGQRGDVAILVGTNGLALIFLRNDSAPLQSVGSSTGSAVKLIWNPFTILCCLLVNGKTLWSWRMEAQSYVSDIISLICQKKKNQESTVVTNFLLCHL